MMLRRFSLLLLQIAVAAAVFVLLSACAPQPGVTLPPTPTVPPAPTTSLAPTIQSATPTAQPVPAIPSADPAVAPQDPDPATITVVGLLDAWMRGEDVRPYLALNLRAEAEAGRPLDQILGLHPITLESYAVHAPISRPEATGFYLIPATLGYQGFSETRLFTVTAEGHDWRISATASEN